MADDWGAFGSDDSDSDNDGGGDDRNHIDDDKEKRLPGNCSASDDAASSATVLFLTRRFLQTNSKIPLQQRRIAVMPESDTDETAKRREDYWGKFLIERGFRIADQETESLSLLVDALLR